MILDELVLTNFAAFQGRQELHLTPMPGRPVVVIGALNGTGKTTILEALQLALFGSVAPVGSRRGVGYEEYLRQAIHRSADPQVGAAVELAFRAHFDGSVQSFRVVRRWWLSSAQKVREDVQVERNGSIDPSMSDSWAELVEAFVPRGVAGLFFFDGEQIEAFADLQSSRELIRTAVGGLLGLDLIDRLMADLAVLERRKRIEAAETDADRAHLNKLVRHLESCRTAEQERVHEASVAAANLQRAAADFAAKHERYVRDGGELHAARATLEAKAAAARSAVDVAAARLIDAAGGLAPLLLIPDLLRATTAQAAAELRQQGDQSLADALEERDAQVLALLQRVTGSGRRAALEVERFLTEDVAARRTAHTARVLRPTPEDVRLLDQLTSGALEAEKAELLGLLKAYEKSLEGANRSLRQLAAIPTPEDLADAAVAREQARETELREEERFAAANSAAEAARATRERASAVLEAELARVARTQLDAEDAGRTANYAARARTTLKQLREAATARHVSQIQAHVEQSARTLLRKRNLIAEVEIDPATHEITLLDREGGVVRPGRLSAGERQLLGVSILWGLARAAGRPLPVVIDTPLGRLDGPHRGRILDSYLPHASHQVVVLSTDTEVDGDALTRLGPAVSHTIHLVHDEEISATRVDRGYFMAEGAIA